MSWERKTGFALDTGQWLWATGRQVGFVQICHKKEEKGIASGRNPGAGMQRMLITDKRRRRIEKNLSDKRNLLDVEGVS